MNSISEPMIRVVDMNIGGEVVSTMVSTFPLVQSDPFSSGGAAVPVNTGRIADENRKYVEWGPGNKLPTEVIMKANQSPYVAPSLKHLIDNTVSEGIKAYYVYYIYRNGKMEREQIDFEAAGEWLKQKIKELEVEESASKESTALKTSGLYKTPVDNSKEISKLNEDLKKWETTYKEWKDFQLNSNLDQWIYEQASDATYFWNWFPMLHLDVGLPDKEWNPKIRRISYLEATCTRKGVMDSFGEINYCVYSRTFGNEDDSNPIASASPEDNIRQTVIPALSPQRPSLQLREKVDKQKNNKVRSRTLDYVLPMSVPTPGRFYYSSPSWHTIFRSGIFQYMIAMFYRRAKMMENANMFKYIIHLDQKYIEYECSLRGVQTDDEKKQVFKDLTSRIETFLQDPKNTGKTLMTVEETINGEKIKWVEIELIESPFKGSDVKEDIEEIANVMLFAAGIHPQTVGAIPGKAKVASGSEARELNLLNQLSLFPMKKLLMTPLYVAKYFNNWDDHLYFDIPVHVLTTLDKNKQGVEEMKSSNS